jgi:O-antigen/teichoic acid export membrane protein
MSVRRSLAWTYTAQAICFGITFASTVVIARLVSPRDFGIFAMANAVTIIINVFMQFGLAKYIMREGELSRDTLRTIFTVNFAMTVIYVLAILSGGVAARDLFNSPEVGRFLFVFAIFPLFAMFEFVPQALCAREMRFGPVAFLTVVRAVVMAVSTIIFALNGFGYMSFAWAQILSWAATSIPYNIIEWRPDIWRLRFAGFRALLSFGTQMIGISGLNHLSTRGSEIVLGSLLGLGNLGLYTRAASLPSQLYLNIYGAGSNVIFSRLSKDLREIGAFHDTYVRFMRVLLGLLWPMMFGLAVLAQPVIYVLYGAKWQAAATPLALLTISYAITVAIGMTVEVFILRHETARQVKIETFRSLVGFALFAGGAMIGLAWAAAAKIAEATITFLLYRRPMARFVGGPERDPLKSVYLESSALTLAAVGPSLAVMIWAGWSPKTPVAVVIGAIAFGGVLWLALLIARRHPIYQEGLRLFRGVQVKP